jgi:sugar O-acyltransferase (sialic acid O-acetyltransferase NeuD family)
VSLQAGNSNSWYKHNMPNTPLTIPLINPNEIEAQIIGIHVREGQKVSKGDTVCSLETTKSSFEITAPHAGYVVGLSADATGKRVMAGDFFCYIAESPDWQPPQEADQAYTEPTTEIPAGLRITQPALALARQHGIDLQQFSTDQMVTEKMVQDALNLLGVSKFAPRQSQFKPDDIIIYGGGGHGKSIVELVRSLGIYSLCGIVDDSIPAGGKILGLPVLGGSDILPALKANGLLLATNAVGGIGNVPLRARIFQRILESGLICPELVHPSAIVEASARISSGVQIMPLAYIGSEARIGFGVIVNSGAIVSHDCVLEDYVNISPGAILAGEVHIGRETLIGMGVTINLQVRIGQGARVGNGATIKANVPDQGVVRAGSVWPA